MTDEAATPGTPTLVPRRAGAVALLSSAILFLLYPALRPYTDETTLAGADAFASPAWTGSHAAGMIGFLLLPAGLLALAAHAHLGRTATTPAVLAWLGGALVLPYYGAETFGLAVIGARAAADGDAGLLTLAEDFRLGALPLAFFGTGLLALGAAGVLLAVAAWPTRARWGGLLAGLGLALYLPQFFGAPALRVAHGALLAAGLLLLAADLAPSRGTAGRTTARAREATPQA